VPLVDQQLPVDQQSPLDQQVDQQPPDESLMAVRRRPRGGRTFLVAFLFVFVAIGTWSIATPLFAAPDEPVHIIKAAAVVRGELLGQLQGPSSNAFGVETVPAFYADSRNVPACFHRHATIPASCAPTLNHSSTPTKVFVYNARYPPLYYAIVGLPSLLGTANVDLYLMRLVSAALSAICIALAITSAVVWSRSRLVIAGIVVASTPMVLFLGGVVNPAGLEASAGILVWSSAAILLVEHREEPPLGLVAVVAIGSCILELVRPLSPFWLGLTAIVILGVANLGRLRTLVSYRRVQIGAGLIILVAVAATIWIVKERAFDVYSTTPVGMSVPESTILETSFAHNYFYLPGMIGVFGWFDTYAPQVTYIIWYGLVGVVSLAAAVLGRLRDAVVLALFTVAIVVVPVAISSSQVHRYGFTWAGKDTLAFAVGLPILACALLGQSELARRSARLAGSTAFLAFIAQVAAFFEMLRRYAVGTKGPDFGFLVHSLWRPPVGLPGVLSIEVVALAALAILAWAAARGAAPLPLPLPGSGSYSGNARPSTGIGTVVAAEGGLGTSTRSASLDRASASARAVASKRGRHSRGAHLARRQLAEVAADEAMAAVLQTGIVEPKVVEPQYVEPKVVEPQDVEAKVVEPAPESSAAESPAGGSPAAGLAAAPIPDKSDPIDEPW